MFRWCPGGGDTVERRGGVHTLVLATAIVMAASKARPQRRINGNYRFCPGNRTEGNEHHFGIDFHFDF